MPEITPPVKDDGWRISPNGVHRVKIEDGKVYVETKYKYSGNGAWMPFCISAIPNFKHDMLQLLEICETVQEELTKLESVKENTDG